MTPVCRMYTDRYTHTARDAANRYMLHYTHMGNKNGRRIGDIYLASVFGYNAKKSSPVDIPGAAQRCIL